MIKKTALLIIISATVVLNSVGNVYAISAAVLSNHDYVLTLGIIRDMQIMIDNFGTSDQKKKFDEIKTAFRKASERHYAQEYQRPPVITEEDKPDNNAQYSTEMFFQLKTKLAELLDEVSKGYIARSREILDSTSVQTTDVIIRFGHNTGTYKYFFKSVDPVNDRKPYQTNQYHYYRDKETLERYLRGGYKELQDAENLAANPDFAYLKTKKNKTPDDIETILNTYMNIVKLCRQSKQLGLEIHRLLKVTDLGDIQRKYNVTLSTIIKNPVLDDRIPETYKVDIVDNQKLVYASERSRLGLPQAETQAQSPAASPSAPAGK
jgi:hypothetical protein